MGMFIGTIVSIAILSPIILGYWPGVARLLSISALATAVEALSPPEVDNLLVPFIVAAFSWVIL